LFLCEFQGWSEASAGVCTAPGSYNAPCAAYAYFSAMSSADKMLFEKRCEVCWPCGEAAPIAPPSPSGPVAFTQVSSNARAPEHPTLNLHVVEPNDAAGARELEQESRRFVGHDWACRQGDEVCCILGIASVARRRIQDQALFVEKFLLEMRVFV
jgi:CPW-WPC domain-containing protein